MIFSQQDIDILRLIRWCQFIMPEDVNVLTAETEVRNLVALGLIRQHERSGALIMSKKGVLLLQTFFTEEHLIIRHHIIQQSSNAVCICPNWC